MKIKAFGMEIQVTESAVFVNGKEVYNKIEQYNLDDYPRPILIKKLFSDDLNNQLDQAEQRMNVIGQNGNDGLHYQFWEEMNNNLMNKDRNLDLWESDH